MIKRIENLGKSAFKTMENLINDTGAALAPVNSNSGKTHYENVNLYEVVDSSIQYLQSIADRKNVKINVLHNWKPYSGGTLFAKLNPMLFLRISDNLLANAIEASPDGTVININGDESKNEVRISFQNTGNLMSIGFQCELFSDYVSTKGFGRGLGTYIVKELTEKQNGHIKLISNEKKREYF